MMPKRTGYGWLLLVMIVLLYGCSVVTADEKIGLSANSLRPGDFITISVHAGPESLIEVNFLDNQTKLQFYNDQYVGLISASYFTKPGVYPLKVNISNGIQNETQEYPIEVVKRDFPEDRVVIAESTRKQILTSEKVDADAQKGSEVRQKALAQQLNPLWTGKFIWPVQGKITTEYGLIRYVNNIEEGRHSGLDISAPAGTPVLACNDGQVAFANTMNVTGLTIILNHGLGLYTSYCHLSKMAVEDGAMVKKGDTIGYVGMTGLATGPHLHLTVRLGENCVNPYLLLDKEIKWD
jgi:murein DD-endopeptidase MepM/ murein hydrolase activator NlpD